MRSKHRLPNTIGENDRINSFRAPSEIDTLNFIAVKRSQSPMKSRLGAGDQELSFLAHEKISLKRLGNTRSEGGARKIASCVLLTGKQGISSLGTLELGGCPKTQTDSWDHPKTIFPQRKCP
ncbi:hypothetical protein EAG_01325 [Camponotus floridanus]|uniref:Uncharacterized protein n=1 Tax=Camponotus floridanus TaxID=104421 RepID=E2ARJ2_CAMFO|nr:hypothetical protein EAG_01325 [Camponotus floridanus]